jgi:glycine/sarcosine N-methyltransferase
MSDVAGFYDDLAPRYHRIFLDWAASVRTQGAALDAILRAERGDAAQLVLDCAAGIGTQLLGLAERRHRVAGVDLSSAAVHRAWAEADRTGLSPAVAVADMRAMPFPDGAFDAVVCADNAVAHLLDARSLVLALGQMRRVLRPGGLVVVTVRDYDALRAERPAVLPTHLSPSPEGLVVTVPLLEWADDGETYLLRQLQLQEAPGAGWRTVERRVRCRAHSRAELRRAAEAAGLVHVRCVLPDQSRFYQPVLLADAP